MTLIKYRDPHDKDYTYFWIDEETECLLSPIFKDEQSAKEWLDVPKNWNSIKDEV